MAPTWGKARAHVSSLALRRRTSQTNVYREGGLGQAPKCQKGKSQTRGTPHFVPRVPTAPFSLAQKKLAGLNTHPAKASRELRTGRKHYLCGPRADHGNRSQPSDMGKRRINYTRFGRPIKIQFRVSSRNAFWG